MTKPSRCLSDGFEARFGLSLQDVQRAPNLQNAAMERGLIHAPVPPHTITLAFPLEINLKESPAKDVFIHEIKDGSYYLEHSIQT